MVSVSGVCHQATHANLDSKENHSCQRKGLTNSHCEHHGLKLLQPPSPNQLLNKGQSSRAQHIAMSTLNMAKLVTMRMQMTTEMKQMVKGTVKKMEMKKKRGNWCQNRTRLTEVGTKARRSLQRKNTSNPMARSQCGLTECQNAVPNHPAAITVTLMEKASSCSHSSEGWPEQ